MKKYIGSCSDDSIGIGTLLIGISYMKLDDGFLLLVDGDLISCYDVVEISTEINHK